SPTLPCLECILSSQPATKFEVGNCIVVVGTVPPAVPAFRSEILPNQPMLGNLSVGNAQSAGAARFVLKSEYATGPSVFCESASTNRNFVVESKLTPGFSRTP